MKKIIIAGLVIAVMALAHVGNSQGFIWIQWTIGRYTAGLQVAPDAGLYICDENQNQLVPLSDMGC